MTTRTLMLAALVLAGCSAGSPETPPAESTASAPAPAPAEAPAFRLAAADGSGEVSLADTVKASAGAPTVLVLGSASCSFSRQEVDELAAANPAYRVLAVVQGSAAEVKGTLPARIPFPVLVDADGAVLSKYNVTATPSVVILSGSGAIAYAGKGGYLPPATVEELAGKVSRGEAVDASAVKPQGG